MMDDFGLLHGDRVGAAQVEHVARDLFFQAHPIKVTTVHVVHFPRADFPRLILL